MIKQALLSVFMLASTCGGGGSLLDRVHHDAKCGMTLGDVERAVSQYTRLERDFSGEWKVKDGNTEVLLTFSNDRLRTTQLKRYHAASTHVDLGPIEDLCSGKKSGVLVVSAPLQLMNATVYIDSISAGELSPTATKLTISLEPHQVRLSKSGWKPVVGTVSFQPDSGFTRFDVDDAMIARDE